MIVEAVGISVNALAQGKEGKDRAARLQSVMEAAVREVYAEGINDPERRAEAVKERIAAARARVMAEGA